MGRTAIDAYNPATPKDMEESELLELVSARVKEAIVDTQKTRKALRKTFKNLGTLRRKFNRYRQGGFDALFRHPRSDRGKPRNTGPEVMQKAIELKKEQPYRSPAVINQFLQEMYSTRVPRASLYRD